MALMNVNDMLKEFSKVISKIREGTQLTAADKDHLSEVYNYLSKSSRQSSLTNLLHGGSAQVTRVDKLLGQERAILEKHQEFVEKKLIKQSNILERSNLGAMLCFLQFGDLLKNGLIHFGDLSQHYLW